MVYHLTKYNCKKNSAALLILIEMARKQATMHSSI